VIACSKIKDIWASCVYEKIASGNSCAEDRRKKKVIGEPRFPGLMLKT
jgi:hypothetical protein